MLSTLALPVLLLGCLKTPGAPENFVLGEEADRTPLSELCHDPSLGEDSFCLPTDLEPWMRDARLRFLNGETFDGGASGIMKLRAELTAENGEVRVVDTKWKPGPKRFTGLNNSPRKEVAAFQIQKLFLAPDRWVAPPTVMRCVEPVQGTVPKRSGGKDFDCVWGVLSYWIDNIEAPETIDEQRFQTDVAYRTAIADLNLFTYVIGHRDTHRNNWYMSTDEDHVRGASVDNGVAFSGVKNYFVAIDWGDIHVPVLASDSVERLRSITDADLEKLRVLGAWRVEDGDLVRIPMDTPPGKTAITYEDGLLVHGLSHHEVEEVRERIDEVLAQVDSGEIGTFDPAPADEAGLVDADR